MNKKISFLLFNEFNYLIISNPTSGSEEALLLQKSPIYDKPRTTAQPIELQTFFYSFTGEKAENKYKKIIGKKEALNSML